MGKFLSRRQFLGLASFATVGLGLSASAVAQGYQFGITRHTRTLQGLQKPLRAAFLTDLHFGRYISVGSVREWVAATNQLQPDVVLLGGDQLDHRGHEQTEFLLNELQELSAPLGVWGVWGNHDYGVFGRYGTRRLGEIDSNWSLKRAEVEQQFAQKGIHILRNRGHWLRSDVFLGGVDDFWYGEPNAAETMRRQQESTGPHASLLLMHNPDMLPEWPSPLPDLTLCGHTHGGQVRLPFVGPIARFVPSRHGAMYAMGWVPHPQPAYVSRGLGMSGLPIRYLCTPEIAVFDLLPA